MLIFVPFILVGTTSCNLNNSNQVGRYTTIQLNPNARRTIYTGGKNMFKVFDLTTRNGITGQR